LYVNILANSYKLAVLPPLYNRSEYEVDIVTVLAAAIHGGISIGYFDNFFT
jgi:hypothetical protein